MFENLRVCGCVYVSPSKLQASLNLVETFQMVNPTLNNLKNHCQFDESPGWTIHQSTNKNIWSTLSYFNHEWNFWTTIAKQLKDPLTKTDHTAVMVAYLPPGCDGIFTPCSYQRWQRWRLRSHRVGQLRRKTWRKQRLQKWVASGYPKMGSKWVTCQSSFIESNPCIR